MRRRSLFSRSGCWPRSRVSTGRVAFRESRALPQALPRAMRRRLRNFVQKRAAQRQQIDINDLVRDVYKFVGSDLEHQSVTIDFKLKDSLPVVEADPVEAYMWISLASSVDYPGAEEALAPLDDTLTEEQIEEALVRSETATE